MASDNHAHYSKIGLAVFAGAAAIAWTLVRLGGLGARETPILGETYYDKSVSGLSVGSAVNFRGVQIGKVAAIDFVGNRYPVRGDDNQRIYISMEFDRNALRSHEDEGIPPEEAIEYLVKSGLRATVTASGITGLSRIECDLHPDSPLPDPPSWRPKSAYIPPKVSLLEDFSSAATRVMNQINGMDFTSAWSNVTVAVGNLSESTRSVRSMMDAKRAELGRIVDDLHSAASNAKAALSEIRRNPSSIIRNVRREPLGETK